MEGKLVIIPLVSKSRSEEGDVFLGDCVTKVKVQVVFNANSFRSHELSHPPPCSNLWLGMHCEVTSFSAGVTAAAILRCILFRHQGSASLWTLRNTVRRCLS